MAYPLPDLDDYLTRLQVEEFYRFMGPDPTETMSYELTQESETTS